MMRVEFTVFLLCTFALPEVHNLHSTIFQPGNKTLKEYYEYILVKEDTENRDSCKRTCITGEPSKTCRYHFALEWYEVLSKACFDCPNNTEDCFRLDCIPADGMKRAVLVVNRKLPGPIISICQGDHVVVDLENGLASDSTTIHWHGQKQKKSPHMDGVPLVTQCPILPQTTFRYKFTADDSGTHFWHSHTGMQRGDGVFGAFIVRVPDDQNPHRKLYDYDLDEHVIILMDWDHVIGMQKFTSHHHNDGDNKPTNLLVNGLGRYSVNNSLDTTSSMMPTARFRVKKGYRYRFRVINAGFLNCPIELSIDSHSVNVISSDGYDFKNMTGESIVTYAGERFDFVLHADQPKGVYWMRFGGLMDCDERFTSAHQVAVLQYENDDIATNNNIYPEDIPTYGKSHKNGTQINPLNEGTESLNAVILAPQIESLQDWDESLKEVPDFVYYVSYDFYGKDNHHFYRFPHYGFSNITNTKMLTLTPQLNYISLKYLPFPLFTQRNEIREEMLCNETSMRDKDCKNNYCECPHVINLDLNAVVELIIIDKGFAYDANHPFHLHGHAFRVVAMEKLGPNVTVHEVHEMNKAGKIRRNLRNPPLKDTVTVPDGGFTVLRFQATNPGYWLFHCHIEFHAELGMAIVFKIGEHSDMLSVPKEFPRCGNYLNEENYEKETPDDCSFINSLSLIPSLQGTKCNASINKISHVPYIILLTFIYIVLQFFI